jgi:hypothetical protein
MEFDGLMNMEQNDLPMGAIIGSNDTINWLTPMERVFAQLVTTMQEITNECKEGDVRLCEHATSHMKVFVATPLWGKCEVATHTPENGTW